MSKLRLAAMALLSIFSITQIYTQTRNYQDYVNKHEMRGIWIATVNNIDWPSQPGLSREQLEMETRRILDRVKYIGFNTVFLQVRPSADAIYRSEIEPPTTYLVADGNEKLTFDPLEYWIDEAHRRGLELHAWINPFRVTPRDGFNCADNHLSKTHPEWTIRYAKKLYLDPGLPQTRQYIATVVDDIVSRYDIDGIHFDDYFYPYPVPGETDFADSASFAQHNPDRLPRNQWRRKNVDNVIETTRDIIKQKKPWVAFGISPFGVWRNKADDPEGSDTRAGITNYDILHADVTKWISEGWVDYVVPQIYWEAGNRAADFDVLAAWWAARSTAATQIFVGHAIFKVNTGTKAWENPNEIPTQINKVRHNPRLHGSVLFSYRQFNRDLLGLESSLQNNLYRHKALSPFASQNNDGEEIRITKIKRSRAKITWETEGGQEARFFAVYRYRPGEDFDPRNSSHLIDVVGTPEITLPRPSDEGRERYVYRIAAIDKWRNEHRLSRKISVRY